MPQLPLSSGGPTADDGALLARVTVTSGGTYIASGVVQAFDFFN